MENKKNATERTVPCRTTVFSGQLNTLMSIYFQSRILKTQRELYTITQKAALPVSEKELTHFNKEGRARMVDVSGKDNTTRQATAAATVFMKEETLRLIREGKMAKGDVLAVAQVAGIMAAKKTPSIIPMCHPLLLTGVDIAFHFNDAQNAIAIEATVKVNGQTGVEMEALTAAAATALTVYDMCKAVDRKMEISGLCLLEKMGGKSGHFRREV